MTREEIRDQAYTESLLPLMLGQTAVPVLFAILYVITANSLFSPVDAGVAWMLLLLANVACVEYSVRRES